MEARTASEVVELNQRQSDKLTITLWWVKDTLDTYVSIYDDKTKEINYISVPEGTPSQDVFTHPYAYQDNRSTE